MSKELIGHIGVDAGLCWIGDPCYIMGDNASHRVRDWGKFCDQINHEENFSEPIGGGIGLAVSTGFGDGTYPVYIETSDEGEWGERVKSITIEFIGENVDDDDDDLYAEQLRRDEKNGLYPDRVDDSN